MNFEQLVVFKLGRGKHADPSVGLCAMEAVAWLDGQAHTDAPIGVCPILREVVMRMNDAFDPVTRQRLVPYLPRFLNTIDVKSDRLGHVQRKCGSLESLPLHRPDDMFKLLDELLAIGKQGGFTNDPSRRVDDYKTLIARQRKWEERKLLAMAMASDTASASATTVAWWPDAKCVLASVH